MAIAGRVAIVPKGDWNADATYKRLDAVTYNNTLYFAKKEVPAGTATSNTEYWSKSIVGGVGAIATKEDAGIVKPTDGLSIAEDGTLKVNIDGTTLTMDQVNNVIKLADALKEKINGAFPAANVANNQITTEAGFALDARQANPNVDGTLAKQLSTMAGRLNYIYNIPETFLTFSDIPGTVGIHTYCVTGGEASIPDAPYPYQKGWWNVIQFGTYGSGSLYRLTQIASQVFKTEFGFKGKDELWIRSRHDETWSTWKQLDLNNFGYITNNDDINNDKFFKLGRYYCSYDVVAETLSNAPFKRAFSMDVIDSTGTNQYIAQRAIEFESGHCKYRIRDEGSKHINDWVQLY